MKDITEDDEEEIFEFRSNHKDYLAPGLGLAYPVDLSWFAEKFPDLLDMVKHDITVDFEKAKSDPVVFTASHYSRSKNWNLIVKSVKESNAAEVRAKLEQELPDLLRTWFTEAIRDVKEYSLKHFFINCAADKFEYGNRDER